MWPVLGALGSSLISGITSYFGNRENRDQSAAINAQNIQATREANLQNIAFQQRENELNRALASESSAVNRADNLAINANNIAMQREFAQNGISWRVQDAINSGINPLAALGGSGASFSPAAHISAGGVSQGVAPQVRPELASSSVQSVLPSMGQDISRAVMAAATAQHRDETFNSAMQVASLENMGLRNELLKSQIARARQPAGSVSSPPLPASQRYMVDGQGQTARGQSLVEVKPMEWAPSDPQNLHSEPAAVSDVGHARTATGSYIPTHSKDFHDRAEDDWWQQTMWSLRNFVGPMVSNRWFKPPPAPLKQGHNWGFNPFTGYEQIPTSFQERWTGRR